MLKYLTTHIRDIQHKIAKHVVSHLFSTLSLRSASWSECNQNIASAQAWEQDKSVSLRESKKDQTSHIAKRVVKEWTHRRKFVSFNFPNLVLIWVFTLIELSWRNFRAFYRDSCGRGNASEPAEASLSIKNSYFDTRSESKSFAIKYLMSCFPNQEQSEATYEKQFERLLMASNWKIVIWIDRIF